MRCPVPHRPASPRTTCVKFAPRGSTSWTPTSSERSFAQTIAMSGSLTVVSHPLVNAKLSVLRKAETTPKEFREVCIGGVCFTFSSKTSCLDYVQGIRQISMVLGIEASRDLPTEEFQGVSASIAIKVSTDSEMNILNSKHQLHHLSGPLSSLG